MKELKVWYYMLTLVVIVIVRVKRMRIPMLSSESQENALLSVIK